MHVVVGANVHTFICYDPSRRHNGSERRRRSAGRCVQMVLRWESPSSAQLAHGRQEITAIHCSHSARSRLWSGDNRSLHCHGLLWGLSCHHLVCLCMHTRPRSVQTLRHVQQECCFAGFSLRIYNAFHLHFDCVTAGAWLNGHFLSAVTTGYPTAPSPGILSSANCRLRIVFFTVCWVFGVGETHTPPTTGMSLSIPSGSCSLLNPLGQVPRQLWGHGLQLAGKVRLALSIVLLHHPLFSIAIYSSLSHDLIDCYALSVTLSIALSITLSVALL